MKPYCVTPRCFRILMVACLCLFACATGRPLREVLPAEFQDAGLDLDRKYRVEYDQDPADLGFTATPSGTDVHSRGHSVFARGRPLPDGGVEVGVELEWGQDEAAWDCRILGAVYAHPLDGTPPRPVWHFAPAVTGTPLARFTAAPVEGRPRVYLGTARIPPEGVGWHGLWWAPDVALTSHFLVSVLMVQPDGGLHRQVFSTTVLKARNP